MTFLLATLLATAIGAPVSPQQPPAPAPPPEPPRESIIDDIDPPENHAAQDLKQIGEKATRQKAFTRLQKALAAVRTIRRSGFRCRSDDLETQELRDAIRYYAGAYGLPPDIDRLIDEVAETRGISESDLQRPKGERDKDISTRWGPNFRTVWAAIENLAEIKACEEPPPAPSRTISDAGPPSNNGLSRNGTFAIVGAVVLAAGARVALSEGGDDTNTPPDVSRYNKSFSATLRIDGCVQHQGPLTIDTTASPDGQKLTVVKGGLPFTSEQFDASTGRFRARHRGRVNFPVLGFVDLDWLIEGFHLGNTITGGGPAMVMSSPNPCSGRGDPQTFFEGTAR